MGASQTYVAMEGGSGVSFDNVQWWSAWQHGKEAHEILNGHVDRMKMSQSVRYTNFRKLIAIFEWGFKASQYETIEDAPLTEFANAYNKAQNILETIHAKVCKTNVIPMPLTSGGGYLQRKRAKDLQKALEGEYEENCVEEIKEDVVMDALITGAGFAKVFCEWGRIKIEHVPTEDLVVDDGEGRLRKPRSLFHVTRMDRFECLEQYGGDDEDLHGDAADRRRRILDCKADHDKGSSTAVQQDQIRIIEGWHLPSRPLDFDGDGEPDEDEGKSEKDERKARHDGRHVIAIDGCTLVDGPWERSTFPFAGYIPRRRRRSFWGLSLLHALSAPQNEFERVTRRIQKAVQKIAGGHFLVPRSANVNIRELDNDFGTVVEFDPPAAPQEWNPVPVSPEMLQYQDRIPQQMEMNSGVSAMSTSSQIPAGLQQASGKALEVFDDSDTERLRPYHGALDRWHVALSQLIILEARELAERGKSYSVGYTGKKVLEKIDWRKVLLDEQEYRLKVFPVSSLSSKPAARFAQLEARLNAGTITIEQFRRLDGLPDLEAENDIDTADTDVIDMNLDIIVATGRYLSPEPFDNLMLAKTRAAKFYNMCRAKEGVPEARLELLRNYIADCDALLEAAAGPGAGPAMAPPGMPPGAPPPGMPPGMPRSAAWTPRTPDAAAGRRPHAPDDVRTRCRPMT
jgi:hypothetical protein